MRTSADPSSNRWILPVDVPENVALRALLPALLTFTRMLVDFCSNISIYSSYDHLAALLLSADMSLVVPVLDLLFSLNHSTPFYNQMGSAAVDKKLPGLFRSRLAHLAESWGGKEYGLSMAQCVQEPKLQAILPSGQGSCQLFQFEFVPEQDTNSSSTEGQTTTSNPPSIIIASNPSPSCSSPQRETIEIDKLYQAQESTSSLGEFMQNLVAKYRVPADSQEALYFRLCLAKYFYASLDERRSCVEARLMAIGVNGKWT